MIDSNNDPFDLLSYPQARDNREESRSQPTTTEEPSEYSVSEISNKLKNMVERNFAYVRVRGEFSRVTVAKSGHLYTSLKDEGAVIDAVCWKGSLSKLAVKPEEGLEVICIGRITTYPGSSKYQLIIEATEMAGVGALLKMLEERKQKLAAEGLFDTNRKKALPLIPNKIGVITSPTGAVIKDIMHRLNERFPRDVLLYPVMVQGDSAAKSITEAVNKFNLIKKESPYRPDVIIIARGGGSLEDLMPFNDETLVRAVANSEIPIISAVGHETDTTLIDYAADLRAPTPTAAAEKAVPVKSELFSLLINKYSRIISLTNQIMKQKRVILSGISRGIISPNRLLENYTQKLDYVSAKLDGGLKNWLENKKSALKNVTLRIAPQNLQANLRIYARIISELSQKISKSGADISKKRLEKLQNLSSILQSCSFERILERGYAVIFDEKSKIISSKKLISPNSTLKVRLKDGEVDVKTLK